MILKPLSNRILVKPEIDKEVETTFGLIVNSSKTLTEHGKITVNAKSTIGVVVVGNSMVKKGDRVLFSKFGYDEVVMDDLETLYVISEQNIIGIFE